MSLLLLYLSIVNQTKVSAGLILWMGSQTPFIRSQLISSDGSLTTAMSLKLSIKFF